MKISKVICVMVLVIVLLASTLLTACDDECETVAPAETAVEEPTVAATPGPDSQTQYEELRGEEVFAEIQEVAAKIDEVTAAWGNYSPNVARGFFQREGPAVDDSLAQTTITEVAPRTWFISMPLVNAVLFETDEGLVMVDTGGACQGPALLQAIRSVSDMPIHTAIYTHYHIDHAFGLWAFEEAGDMPQNIIAHESLIDWFNITYQQRENRTYYQPQTLANWPEDEGDFVWPTQTYKGDSLELEIGGEQFVLRHDRGETPDATWVWVPSREVVASGDFYQNMMPNIGNPRRVQRYTEEWATALEEMAALNPEILLPGHGDMVTGKEEVKTALLDVAELLRYIVDYTIDAMNSPDHLRNDQIVQGLELPDHLANNPKLQPHHASAQNIVESILKQYRGWWDDRPSHIDPAPVELEAQEIVRLAGGMDAIVARARELMDTDIKLASHLAEWAFYADPCDPRAQVVFVEVFMKRSWETEMHTMHIASYFYDAAMLAVKTKKACSSE